jgi:hypothetical protein
MANDNTAPGESKPCVFIHVNHKQILGALVGVQSIRRSSAHNEKFDIKLIENKDHPFFLEREGQPFLRAGGPRLWRNNDLQSFTPLRFMPPELMNYSGRAVVIDPDVFAVGDVWDLLNRDMAGKAIMCRPRSRTKRSVNGPMATSVMLLDCAKLKHWKVKEQFNSMFRMELDYKDWITLKHEPRETIGLMDNSWNDLDVLNKRTQMLHTTKRWTQPWKTGLPIDFTPADKIRTFRPLSLLPLGWLVRWRRRTFGDYMFLGHYQQHPDINQENFFFGLLQECLENGTVTMDMVREQMTRNHVRHDAIQVVENVPPVDETLHRLAA